MNTLTLDVKSVHLTDEQFEQLCQHNANWEIEQSAKGELIIMAPVGGESGEREASLIGRLFIWNEQTKLGHVFSSSTIFQLPNGGKRCPKGAGVAPTPDAAWITLELRSKSDDLEILQAKMREYLDGGVSLGWLINPQDQQVEIYRLGQPCDILPLPVDLSGESVLPGFVLSLPILLINYQLPINFCCLIVKVELVKLKWELVRSLRFAPDLLGLGDIQWMLGLSLL